MNHQGTVTYDEHVPIYLMTELPTCCPRCQRRTEFIDIGDGRERHGCLCGFVFIIHGAEVDGEEQCEACREFTALELLDADGVCDQCVATPAH